MQFIEARGARIPAIGLGTMTLKEAVGVNIVSAALRLGYRHIDTAQMYGNEREVGEGLRASGVKRDEVFVTTKVWHDRLKAGDLERSVDESLERLKLPSVDLLLIHWPNPKVPLAETIPALCKVKRNKLTRHIGVANFTVAMLDEADRLADEPLVTNQIEVHPFLDQSKVIAACRRHGMSVTAYCPIARGKAPGNEVLERIGKAHGKSLGAGVAALAGAAGHHRHPADLEGRAADGKSRDLRLHAERRRDGRDRQAQAARRARGQPAARAEVRLKIAAEYRKASRKQ